MPNIGPLEIVLLLLLALLLFGAKRLPEIGRSLGSGMREFKDSVTGTGTKVSDTHTELPAATQDSNATANAATPVPQDRDPVS
jgi:sec-independent protein translocase protein TatA